LGLNVVEKPGLRDFKENWNLNLEQTASNAATVGDRVEEAIEILRRLHEKRGQPANQGGAPEPDNLVPGDRATADSAGDHVR
jgi:hypothetical protein